MMRKVFNITDIFSIKYIIHTVTIQHISYIIIVNKVNIRSDNDNDNTCTLLFGFCFAILYTIIIEICLSSV